MDLHVNHVFFIAVDLGKSTIYVSQKDRLPLPRAAKICVVEIEKHCRSIVLRLRDRGTIGRCETKRKTGNIQKRQAAIASNENEKLLEASTILTAKEK